MINNPIWYHSAQALDSYQNIDRMIRDALRVVGTKNTDLLRQEIELAREDARGSVYTFEQCLSRRIDKLIEVLA